MKIIKGWGNVLTSKSLKHCIWGNNFLILDGSVKWIIKPCVLGIIEISDAFICSVASFLVFLELKKLF